MAEPFWLPEAEAREAIVEACRRMHAAGMIAAADGNVSARIAPDTVVITPAGAAKGFLKPRELVVVKLDGTLVRGDGQASREFAMHRAAYLARPDLGAVVHGHPAMALAFVVAGRPIPDRLLPEVVVELGPIPTAPYATPTTEEVPEALAPYLAQAHKLIMMPWHGALALAKHPLEGYGFLEKLEHLCRVALAAESLGGAKPLPAEAVAKLEALHPGC